MNIRGSRCSGGCSRSVVAALLSFLLAASTAEAGDILFVDDGAPPGGDGTSWETAYRFLQDALDEAAGAPSSIAAIHVAQGLYHPDRDEQNPAGTGDRQASFLLVNTIDILGGFAGIGEPDPDARDIALFLTVLNGDLAGDDAPGFVNIDDNSFHVLTGTDVDDTAVLDGFTISGGNANGPEDSFRRGGGLYNVGSSPTLRTLTFTANHSNRDGAGLANWMGSAPTVIDCAFLANRTFESGGGMFTSGADPSVSGCTFIDNWAGETGGGLYASSGLTEGAVIENCTFQGNTSGLHGGGVKLIGGNPLITGCSFIENQSSGGGAVQQTADAFTILDSMFIDNFATQEGGAIESFVAELTVSGCDFTGNRSLSEGGAVSVGGSSSFKPLVSVQESSFSLNEALARGGALYARGEDLTLDVTDCSFEQNAADIGGGIYNELAEATIVDCSFDANEASTGGGVAVQSGEADVQHCLFENNAGTWGGGLYIGFMSSNVSVRACTFRGQLGYQGGGLYADHSDAAIRDCLFFDNTAYRGAGLYDLDGFLSIRDCRFLGNFAFNTGGAMDIHGDSTVIDCLLAGNTGHDGGGIRTTGDPTLINVTLAHNFASFQGGGLFAWDEKTVLVNCILWGNEPDQVDNLLDPPTITYSIVEGGFPGIGNLDEDPLFIDPGGADEVIGTIDDDFRLRGGSPAIDSCNNLALPPDITTDLAGEPRFIDDPATPDTGVPDGRPPADRGPYEFSGCTGDLDASGDVGFGDLLALLAAWGPCPGCPADLDGDDTVGFGDLLLMLAAWGPCP